jgi:PleD family two-component response regulator
MAPALLDNTECDERAIDCGVWKDPHAAGDAAGQPRPAKVQSLRILLADDSRANRAILVRHLLAAGYRATVAQDGREAVELVPKLTILSPLEPKIR